MVRFTSLVAMTLAVLLAGCSAESSSAPSPAAGGAPTAGSAPAVQQVTFRVPTMVCSKNCWPVVRDALQKQPGVTDVTLAPQKEEVPIDNPLVTVKLNGPFDADKAIEAIAAAGFAKATVEP
jgi:copper chaperone CopZ